MIIVASLGVAMSVYLLTEPSISIPVSLVLGLICLFLLTRLFDVHHTQLLPVNFRLRMPAARRFASGIMPFGAVYLTALLTVWVITPYPETVFAAWSRIGFWNYVRLAATVLLIGYLPGAAVIRAAARWGRFRYSSFDSLVPSFLLSLLIAAFLEWTLLRLGVESTLHDKVSVFVWLVVLVFAAFLERRGASREGDRSRAIPSSGADKVLLLSVILLYVIVGFSLNFLDRLLLFDAPVHISGALSILRANRPLEENHFLQRIAGEGLWYPSWFRILLANLFVVSGFPPINAAHLFDLVILRTFPIIAFYQLVQALVGRKHEKVPIVATTIFFLFSGSVWLPALKNGVRFAVDLASSGVLDRRGTLFDLLDLLSTQNVFIGQYPIYTQFIHAVVPQPIGLTSMFFVLGLAKTAALPDAWRGTLAFAATGVGFLFHEIEAILMVILFFPLLLLFFGKSIRLFVIFLSTSAAFLLVLVVDLISPARFFAHRSEFWIGFTASLLLLVLCSAPRHGPKIPSAWMPNSLTIRRFLFPLLTGFLVSAYALGLWLWIWKPSTAQSWVFVPWPYYPVFFGVAGILALVELVYLLRQNGEVFGSSERFLMASVLGMLAIADVAPRFNMQVHEYRLLSYSFIGVSIFAASALVRIMSRLKQVRAVAARTVGPALVAMLFLSGTSGTMFAVSYWRISEAHLPYSVLEAEVGAVNFLRARRPLHGDVGTVNWLSRVAVIYSGAEHNWLADFEPLFGESDPTAVLGFLNHRGLTNLYLTSRDLRDLASWGYDTGFLMKHLIRYLPVDYQDGSTAIYRIPALAPPTTTAETALIIPSSYFLLDAIALAGVRYSTYLPGDPRQFQSKAIFVDDFAELDIPITDLSRWRRAWEARVEKAGTRVSLSFETEVTHRTQMWASLELPRLRNAFGSHLCIQYQGIPLPPGASYYYFELRDRNSRKLSSSTLEIKDSRVQTACYPLPSSVSPSRVTFAVDTGNAGPMRARLDIISAKVVAGPWFPWDVQSVGRDPSEYVSWARKGGRLIVVGDAQGVLANMLSLRVRGTRKVDGIQGVSRFIPIPPLMIDVVESERNDIRVLTNYSLGGKPVAPLALARKVGRGEIIYLALSAYFAAADQAASTDNGRRLFRALGDVVESLNLGLAKHNEASPTQSLAFARDVTLSGDVKIRSTAPPMFPPGDLRVATLSLGSVAGVRVSGQGEDERILSNAMIEKVSTSSPSVSTLTVRQARLLPKGVGSYVFVDVSGPFDWTLSSDGQIEIRVRKYNKRFSVTVRGGQISFKGVTLQGDTLTIYQPEFVADGAGRFGYATIFEKNPHGGIAWRYWMLINGTVRFKVGNSGTYLHIRDIALRGRVQAGRINEWWTIPNYSRMVDYSQQSLSE